MMIRRGLDKLLQPLRLERRRGHTQVRLMSSAPEETMLPPPNNLHLLLLMGAPHQFMASNLRSKGISNPAMVHQRRYRAPSLSTDSNPLTLQLDISLLKLDIRGLAHRSLVHKEVLLE